MIYINQIMKYKYFEYMSTHPKILLIVIFYFHKIFSNLIFKTTGILVLEIITLQKYLYKIFEIQLYISKISYISKHVETFL